MKESADDGCPDLSIGARALLYGVVLSSAILLVVPIVYTSDPPRIRPEAVQDPPTFVTIGNSMEGSRIDSGVMNELLPEGERHLSLRRTGSRIEDWYLMFRNRIVLPGLRPKVVMIFFRAYELVTEENRLSEGKARHFRQQGAWTDPDFQRVVGRGSILFGFDKLRAAILDHYRFELPVTTLNQSVERAALYFSDAVIRTTNRPWRPTRSNVNAYLRKAPRKVAAWNQRVSSGRIESSLLPPLIALAKDNSIRLCFYLVDFAPHNKPRLRAPSMYYQYYHELAGYLASHDACFIDGNQELSIPGNWYMAAGRDDHIHFDTRFAEAYTREFYERVASRFFP